jgi:hypothetical protein
MRIPSFLNTEPSIETWHSLLLQAKAMQGQLELQTQHHCESDAQLRCCRAVTPHEATRKEEGTADLVDDSSRGTRAWRSEAVEWYLKVAEQGDAKAQLFLGLSFEFGLGVPQDSTTATGWYQKASGNGCAQAQFLLGLAYSHGHGLPLDPARAAKWFREAAEQGYPKAQSKLGACYLQGEGVHQDDAEALLWYRNAAEQGDVEALLQLGHCYRQGRGVPQDCGTAFLWYHKAAEQTSLLLETCQPAFECDYAEILGWYQIAAGQGPTKAQSLLGLSYDLGQGVYRDYSEAVKRCLEAAEQGFAPMQFRLGCIYDVWQESAGAVVWYLRAAEQGLPEAQRNLGACYYHGHGIPRDYSKAHHWLSLAVLNGEDEVSGLRDEAARKLAE